jgi:hypothetical protein
MVKLVNDHEIKRAVDEIVICGSGADGGEEKISFVFGMTFENSSKTSALPEDSLESP